MVRGYIRGFQIQKWIYMWVGARTITLEENLPSVKVRF